MNGKPFYSADNIPQWAKDKLTEHWSLSYNERMIDIVHRMRLFYNREEPFSIVDDVIYFNCSGVNILVDYICRRGYMTVDDASKLRDALLCSQDMTRVIWDKMFFDQNWS